MLGLEGRGAAPARRAGRPRTSPSIALGAILHDLGLLTELVGRRETRRLDAAIRTLPPAAQIFLAVLRDQRCRGALIG